MSQYHEEIVFVSAFPGALASDNFSMAQAEILDSNMLLLFFHQYPCLFGILFECHLNTHGQGMMLVLPNQRLS